MKPAARKAGVRLFKEKVQTSLFFFRNRKRKPLAAGFICFFLLLYGLSFFIWDISFEGNLRFTDQTLLHYMETLPVACGMRKSAVSCEEAGESEKPVCRDHLGIGRDQRDQAHSADQGERGHAVACGARPDALRSDG